jgi:short-subunit dehydrogenase
MLKPSSKVLVTGAAGGLGTAIAKAFAAGGHKLVLSARNASQIEQLAADLSAETIICNLENRDQLRNLIEQAADVDIAILNAALPASGSLLEYDVEQIDRALEVNLRAPLVTARLLADSMRARGYGHIVFISSLSGKVASPGTTLYSTTKFALRGGALGLRHDLHGTGVGVSVICPGFVSDAGMFADTGAKLPSGLSTVTPEDVAEKTVMAVEKDRAVVDVAPLALRAASAFGQVAPQLLERGQRLSGGEKLASHMAEQQRSKR